MTEEEAAEANFLRQQVAAKAILNFLHAEGFEAYQAVFVCAAATGAAIAVVHPDNRDTCRRGAAKLMKASEQAQVRMIDAYDRAGTAGISPVAGTA
jgi:hypothetical protein